MSIAWNTVEDAIHTWCVAGSGLPASRVIWAQQGGPRPSEAFISLQILSIRRVGQDWLQVEDADEPEPGLEVRHLSRGVRECTLSIQCFDGEAIGITSSLAIVENIVASLSLPTAEDALNAAGIGVARFEPVQSLGGLRGKAVNGRTTSIVFEPRAVTTATFFLASEVEELGTFIEFAELENLNTNTSTYVPEDPNS